MRPKPHYNLSWRAGISRPPPALPTPPDDYTRGRPRREAFGRPRHCVGKQGRPAGGCLLVCGRVWDMYSMGPAHRKKTASRDISQVGVWPEFFRASWRRPGVCSESEQTVNVCSCTRSIQENYRRCRQNSGSGRFPRKTLISGRFPVTASFFRHSAILLFVYASGPTERKKPQVSKCHSCRARLSV